MAPTLSARPPCSAELPPPAELRGRVQHVVSQREQEVRSLSDQIKELQGKVRGRRARESERSVRRGGRPAPPRLPAAVCRASPAQPAPLHKPTQPHVPTLCRFLLQISAHDGTLAATRRQLEAAQAEQERCMAQVQSGLAASGGAAAAQVPEPSQGEAGRQHAGRGERRGKAWSTVHVCRPGIEQGPEPGSMTARPAPFARLPFRAPIWQAAARWQMASRSARRRRSRSRSKRTSRSGRFANWGGCSMHAPLLRCSALPPLLLPLLYRLCAAAECSPPPRRPALN